MDETRTDEALEALADLFLTGDPPLDGEPHVAWPRRRPDPRTAMRGDPSGAGPAGGPMRLPPNPKTGPAGAARGDRPVLQAIGPSGPGASRRHVVDGHLAQAVLLGNLPGFARPWLTQYAHQLACARGPVGVIHLAGEQIDLEVVSTQDDPALVAHATPRGDTAADAPALAACLHRMANAPEGAVQTWLVHLPVPPTPETLAIALQLPNWTILSGADDPAIVGTYRLLKQHLERDPHACERCVELMVMGADDEDGARASEKLSSATDSFLRTPVRSAGSLRRMVPLGQRFLGSFADDGGLWPVVRDFIETLALQVLEPGSASTGPPMPDTPETPMTPLTQTAQDTAGVAGAPRPAAADGAGSPEAETRADDRADGSLPGLATFLTGVVPLEARCPHHPRGELVLDEAGRIHLLGCCRIAGDAVDELKTAIVDLLGARAWVIEHLPLLQLTQRQCRFDPASEPLLHLFTNHARAAVALTRDAPPSLRLHLLQRVSVGDSHTWCCTALN